MVIEELSELAGEAVDGKTARWYDKRTRGGAQLKQLVLCVFSADATLFDPPIITDYTKAEASGNS